MSSRDEIRSSVIELLDILNKCVFHDAGIVRTAATLVGVHLESLSCTMLWASSPYARPEDAHRKTHECLLTGISKVLNAVSRESNDLSLISFLKAEYGPLLAALQTGPLIGPAVDQLGVIAVKVISKVWATLPKK